MSTRVTGDEFLRLIHETIPGSRGTNLHVEEMGEGMARLRLRYDDEQLRAGGTINGPTMMMLADTALYAAVLSVVGLEPLAVTTDLAFHFYRRPQPEDLVAEARILKSGKRLVVGEVLLRSSGMTDSVAHAIGTYALPTAG